MNKLSVEKFREIKTTLIKIMQEAEEYNKDNNQDTDELLEKYVELQTTLLSYDLSDIPYEEWKGILLYSEDELDLSNTHANIDLSLLEDIQFDTIKLHGCNVKGIDIINYDENTFDKEFMESHPEYFPDETLPEETKKAFYEQKLLFQDILKYPSLRKCINENSFSGNYFSSSKRLIDAIGFENAIRFFDEYPNFISEITYNKTKNGIDNELYEFIRPTINITTYEDAKKYVYEQIINTIKKYYRRRFPTFDIIPKEMIESFPNIFIEDGALPEEIVNNYYEGNLSINEIRYYYEILKTKDLEIGTRSSSVRKIIQLFGSFDLFMKQVPEEFDQIVNNFIERYIYDEEMLNHLELMDANKIIEYSINHALSQPWSYFSLEEKYNFSKYLPIENIFKNENICLFINKCGFENIINYNNNNKNILDTTENYHHQLINVLSEFYSIIKEDTITSEEELSKIIEKIIHQIRIEQSGTSMYAIKANKLQLSKIYPKEFLDYEMLEIILADIPEKKKASIIEKLENGFNGDMQVLIEMINEKPNLLPAIRGKKLIINNSTIEKLYQEIEEDKFFTICAKYGEGIYQIVSNLSDEGFKRLIFELNNENYEEKLNEYIYNFISNSNNRLVDIRKLPESFKEKYPQLYIDKNAPEELQEIFYGKKFYGSNYMLIRTENIQEHPEWIPYLMSVDLKRCLEYRGINVYNLRKRNDYSHIYDRMNLYEALELKFEQSEILQIISKYGKYLDMHLKLDMSLEKEDLYNNLMESIAKSFKINDKFYNIDSLPQEFIDKYPELFLDEKAPEELKKYFYQKRLNEKSIIEHPEWKEWLQEKSIEIAYNINIRQFTKDCKRLGCDNNKIFDLYEKYGECISKYEINLSAVSKESNEIIEDIIKEQIIYAITVEEIGYNEEVRKLIGSQRPDLFLDEKAPEELKQYFYNYSYSITDKNKNTPLTFELLSKNKEWLQYLEGKNVLLSLKKGITGVDDLEKLFKRYGDKKALTIGMKNPESVTKMLNENRFELLILWYEKLNFIPHHVVMKEFPFDQSDKFISSGKKWSQLMRIERHNINEDTKAALLKASMCFGVFDNDNDGYNKIIQLFTGIPHKISEEDMNKMQLHFQESIVLLLNSNKDKLKLEETMQNLFLLEQCYEKNENNQYILNINQQENKKTVHKLRTIMEECDISTILTPDKSHKLFGGFEMTYEPDFRDFILINMHTILSSDEYISYISSMQKQWKKIKAINSNRVLTLDLALAFVKSNEYENIEIGNESLAEISNIAGYSQKDFETLQKIYDYGKLRTFSSIPRIEKRTDEYTYEILRLDDPLALAIGTLTDCCQELGNAAETSMQHSMVDKNGRIFVIKDSLGNIVAQSWVWRNQNVICFDNIEVPSKAFTRAKKIGQSIEELTDIVFSLYKEAGEELIKKDEIELKKLLQQGQITKEQYDSLKLGKVTVGMGYNDIAASIKRNAKEDYDITRPLPFNSPVKLKNSLYTADSATQYIVAGEEKVKTSDYQTLTLYPDEFVIYDDSNFKEKELLKLQLLESSTKEKNHYSRLTINVKENFVSEIAYNYLIDPKTTKIIMNANFAIIYTDTEKEIVLNDIFYNSQMNNLSDEINSHENILLQIRMALEQISFSQNKLLNINELELNQNKLITEILNYDEKIYEERGLNHGSR